MKFSTSLLVRLIPLFLLCCGAGGMEAQEIRRALPVEPMQPRHRKWRRTSRRPRRFPRTNTVRAASRPSVPAGPASVNDTARFIAGLPVSEGSPLAGLTLDPAWQQHAGFFDEAWAKLAERQFVGIRDWEVNYLPDATQPLPVMFLPSTPGFSLRHQFFPNASTYILAGKEPIGPLPDILRFAGPALEPVLQNLQISLNSVLNFSFFITKDMKNDLQRGELKGTLPIFYVFLARAGKTITDISFVTLDKNGQPQPTQPNENRERSHPRGADRFQNRRQRRLPNALLFHDGSLQRGDS